MTVDGQSYIDRGRRRLAAYQPRSLDAPRSVPAAVLLLLLHDQGTDRVLLTVRSHTVEHHKSEISFPGGAEHASDADLAVTALRETWEEVGVEPEHVELIGRLDDMITVSNFVVRPFVGVLKRSTRDYLPNPVEVAEILEVPVAHLLDAANLTWEDRQVGDRWLRSPAYHYEGYRIWGATARMLHQFLMLLQGEGPADPEEPVSGRGSE